ncbi:2-carboxy-1,4-naphthoquinone phytyltransferase [Spirulina sp. 06S082]|uniref:2-carboxy-1,4-naphthoquinone phytyltransferase n=1 Tax=Spirulina sp. 06S082 TaxID=3110248 RepID=UPI002B22079F|nr:2-carboxy-1,4-naphthoquinone phytyltransferase [Spirulina sp. 06S082]MEA5470747.1 2-carboxy-1,4-naphthoquinone phytyltransferase [Spirulina sp. 06S082]
MTTTPLTQPDRRQLWYAAIKPPMYTVAVIPITVGTAVAYGQNNGLNWSIFLTFLGSAIAIIAWMNLSNDFFDSETGIDRNKLHSVVNLTGNKFLVFWLSSLFLLLGILGIVSISWRQQDWMVLELILLSCALGYSYQGPPFRLGYQGLGEFICFVTFGPLAIAAAYYSQTQSFSSTAFAVSILIGITTSIILFCSHFHQVEDDLAAGKRSPIVRLGTKLGAKVLAGATGSIFIFTPLFIALGYFPLWTLLLFLSLPLAYQVVHFVWQNHDIPEKVKVCKFIAVKFHFWSGLLLSLGFILPNFI